MKKSDIYEIAIKLMGLYLFFTSIELIQYLLTTLVVMVDAQHDQDQSFYLMMFLVTCVIFVLVILFASFLTFKTKAIVKYVCKPIDYEETAALFADRKVIYEIALVVMGLLLIVWTLPDFIFKLNNYMQLTEIDMPQVDPGTNFLIVAAIKIFVGLIAVIFAKSIAPFLGKDDKVELAD